MACTGNSPNQVALYINYRDSTHSTSRQVLIVLGISLAKHVICHMIPRVLTYNCNHSVTLAIDIRDSTGTVIYALTMSGLGRSLVPRPYPLPYR